MPHLATDPALAAGAVPQRREAPAHHDTPKRAGAFFAGGAGIVITDAGMHIVAVNEAYAEAVGLAAAALCGGLLQGEPARRALQADPQGEAVALQHCAGRKRPARMRVDMLRDAQGAVQRHVFTFTDIDAVGREQGTPCDPVRHDRLPGLPQRVRLADELQRCVARARRQARPMALMFIDIDHFKRVNDSLGQGAGDTLLHHFGHRLRHALRAEDVVARLGGDEFAAVLEDLDGSDDAASAAQGILRSLAPGFEIDGHTLPVSASIGIAMFPDDADDAVGLTRAADAAMYLAKQQGRAHIRFCGGAALRSA